MVQDSRTVIARDLPSHLMAAALDLIPHPPGSLKIPVHMATVMDAVKVSPCSLAAVDLPHSPMVDAAGVVLDKVDLSLYRTGCN